MIIALTKFLFSIKYVRFTFFLWSCCVFGLGNFRSVTITFLCNSAINAENVSKLNHTNKSAVAPLHGYDKQWPSLVTSKKNHRSVILSSTSTRSILELRYIHMLCSAADRYRVWNAKTYIWDEARGRVLSYTLSDIITFFMNIIIHA